MKTLEVPFDPIGANKIDFGTPEAMPKFLGGLLNSSASEKGFAQQSKEEKEKKT